MWLQGPASVPSTSVRRSALAPAVLIVLGLSLTTPRVSGYAATPAESLMGGSWSTTESFHTADDVVLCNSQGKKIRDCADTGCSATSSADRSDSSNKCKAGGSGTCEWDDCAEKWSARQYKDGKDLCTRSGFASRCPVLCRVRDPPQCECVNVANESVPLPLCRCQ